MHDTVVRDLLEDVEKDAKHYGRFIRLAVELMIGQRFHVVNIRKPRRRTFSTKSGVFLIILDFSIWSDLSSWEIFFSEFYY